MFSVIAGGPSHRSAMMQQIVTTELFRFMAQGAVVGDCGGGVPRGPVSGGSGGGGGGVVVFLVQGNANFAQFVRGCPSLINLVEHVINF